MDPLCYIQASALGKNSNKERSLMCIEHLLRAKLFMSAYHVEILDP